MRGVRRLFSVKSGNASFRFAENRPLILSGALNNVKTMGWTDESIRQAVLQLGLPIDAMKVISRGPVELCEHFLVEKLEDVRCAMEDEQGLKGKGEAEGQSEQASEQHQRHPLASMLSKHAHHLLPWAPHWPSAAILLMNPSNFFTSLDLLLRTVEDLHMYAHMASEEEEDASEKLDRAPPDPYVDRALLALLYLVTDLYVVGVSDGDEALATGAHGVHDGGDGEPDPHCDAYNTQTSQDVDTFINGAVRLYLSVRRKLPPTAVDALRR